MTLPSNTNIHITIEKYIYRVEMFQSFNPKNTYIDMDCGKRMRCFGAVGNVVTIGRGIWGNRRGTKLVSLLSRPFVSVFHDPASTNISTLYLLFG